MKRMILFSLILLAQPVNAADRCSAIFGTSIEESALSSSANELMLPVRDPGFNESWGRSQFRYRSPKKFQLLVHAIREFRLQDNPESVLERYFDDRYLNQTEVISTSLIDGSKSPTVGMSGLVIESPPENIIGAGGDMMSMRLNGASSNERQNIISYISSNQSASPTELLQRTAADLHANNEVALISISPSHTKIVVKGVYIKTDSFGQPLLLENVYTAWKSVASKRRLPIFYLSPSDNMHLIKALLVDRETLRLECSREEFEGLKNDGLPIVAVRYTAANLRDLNFYERYIALNPESEVAIDARAARTESVTGTWGLPLPKRIVFARGQ